jgi:hypothetical protein
MSRRSWASDKFRAHRRREAVQAKVSRPPPPKSKEELRADAAAAFIAWRAKRQQRADE